MGGGLRGATVSSDLVRVLLRGLPGGREAMAELLRGAGMDPDLLDVAHARFPVARFDALWRALESAADDPDFGLHLGELAQTLPSGHVLVSAMLNSARVGDALRRFCRYHDLMADVASPRLVERDSEAVLCLQPRHRSYPLRRHPVECIACLVVSVLRQLTEGEFVGEVRFGHQRPADVSEHLRIFGPSVLFDQPANELVFGRRLLDQPIAAADAQLLGLLDQYADQALRRLQERSLWSGRVADLVTAALCDGRPALVEIAGILSLSPRSLQVHLRDEGTSFQAILDEVRRGLATAYLERSDLTLSEITFLLGFTDQSAFTRAFKKWTGAPPQRYREGETNQR